MRSVGYDSALDLAVYVFSLYCTYVHIHKYVKSRQVATAKFAPVGLEDLLVLQL